MKRMYNEDILLLQRKDGETGGQDAVRARTLYTHKSTLFFVDIIIIYNLSRSSQAIYIISRTLEISIGNLAPGIRGNPNWGI